MNKLYILADDCPNCGEKDEPHLWKGARMGSTSWGHSFLCCSDKCGYEFLNSPEHKRRMRERLQEEIRERQEALKSWL